MTVCSNTTPFIALCSIGRLDLLPAIFGTIHVPASVVQECAAGGLIVVPPLGSLSWVVVHPAPSGQLVGAWDLDAGEKDSILLALALNAELILLDEKLGRNTAEHHGLRVSGTLGVLVKAKTMGLIPSFCDAAEAMRTQGVRYNRALIRKLATHLGEE